MVVTSQSKNSGQSFSIIEILEKPRQIDIVLFTKHLSMLVKSGISVAEALSILIAQTKSSYFKKVLTLVLRDVDAGKSISSSLSKFPQVFDSFYISMVEISEKSGSLDENLEFLSKQLDKYFLLRRKIQGAMLYPGLVLFAATAMGGFVSYFILPQLSGFFSTLDVDLPTSTKMLLFWANLFKYHGLIILLGFALFMIMISLLVKTKYFKPSWDKFLLFLPLVGDFLRAGEVAQISRTLGVLVKSGVQITDSLLITSQTINNSVFKNYLVEISESVNSGVGISQSIEKHKFKEFPALVTKMIGVGEKTGNLDTSLLYIGDFYEEEIDVKTKNLTTVLEPILLLGIGLVVGFLALAIISPIYELSSAIR
jgi:type IV pilus assembly protein PilC